MVIKKCAQCQTDFYDSTLETCCSVACKILNGIRKEENGCWIYNKVTGSGNSGRIRWRNRWYGVGKMAYNALVDEVPPHKYVDTTCDEKRCVNPDHMFLGFIAQKKMGK